MTDTASRPAVATETASASENPGPADYTPLNRRRLIAPGPVEVEPRVLAQLAQPQMHHRAPEGVAKLMQTRAQLTELLGAPGYESVTVSRPWGEILDPGEVADAAKDAHTLLVTHSETSTGALHDLAAIAAAAKAQNPDLIIIADCITSYGVAELRPEEWGVDVIVSGSQKGTATPPGLGLLLFGPQARERLIPDTQRGFYLDMQRELKGQMAGNTPQTPAINLIYALSASLERLLSVPREVLWAEKKRQNDALLAAGTAMGARAWASRTSPAVAVLCPPVGIGGKAVAAQLASMGQRALPGQAPHEDTVFRVSNMGYADRYDALSIAGILEDALSELGAEFERGAGVAAAWAALK
jgi:aspartate aminotransferase-like enzyme